MFEARKTPCLVTLLPHQSGLTVKRVQDQSKYTQCCLQAAITASSKVIKWEDNDEIRRILAYVYLVEHKAVSFSAFSTFF